MPDILFYSTNEDFKTDLQDQIAHHAKEYGFVEEDNEVGPDIVIVDEDLQKAVELQQKYANAPLFWLTSTPEALPDDVNPNHLMVKPFRLTHFLDELHSCLNLFDNSEDGYICFNQYIVRPIKKDIVNQRNNEVIKLTEKEVAIIKYLYKSQDHIVTKNDLLQNVWGYAPDVTTHTIETHVYRLRQKVEHEDENAQLIVTIDGGYKLKV